MSEAWVGILKTTIPQFIRKVEPATMRRRAVMAMLQKKGRVSFNNTGHSMDWRVKKKRNVLTPYTDMQQLNFQRLSRFEEAVLPWRAYVMNEVYSEPDRLRNSGTEAIVKDVSNRVEEALEDAQEAFHDEFYIDGNAAANSERMHGIESFMGTTGAQAAGNNKIIVPSDTYATLLTNLGNYGGSWSTVSSNVNWPDGTGDIEYEYWTPTIIDYRSSGFSSTATWQANCIAAMRYALTSKSRNKAQSDSQFFLLERTMLAEFKTEQELKERISVDKSDSPLRSLGFQAVRFDGVDIIDEYGIPVSTGTDTRVGYLIDIDDIELKIQHDRLFKPWGPTFDEKQLAYLITIGIFGNFRFKRPGRQTKLYGL